MKTGIVIDLGKQHTKINAIDAIQAMNRFRNRQSRCTVFLPPLFKDDSKHPTRKFNYGNTGSIALGLNRFNYPILTNSKNAKTFIAEKKEDEVKIYSREMIRNNPESVSMITIDQLTTQEKNRKCILDKFEGQLSIYDDWFHSIDGYHYLAQEAGFLSIIWNKTIGEPLKKMTKDQIDIENKVVSNFINDHKALNYLQNQLEPDKRILVRTSNVVTDPQSDKLGNFHVVDRRNGKYIVKGDFHYSHERMLNQLISSHLSFAYWYGPEIGIVLLRSSTNPKKSLLANNSKRYIDAITTYVQQCRACASPYNLRGKNFFKALDTLSDKDIGITKYESPLEVTLTIKSETLSKSIRDMWAKQQYDRVHFNIKNLNGWNKNELSDYYDNPEQLKKQDIEELNNELKYLCNYTPLKYDKTGKIKSYENFIIPKVLYSEYLIKVWEKEEKPVCPELSNLENNKKELDRFCEDVLDKFNIYTKSKNSSIPSFLENYTKLKNFLIDKKIQDCIDYLQSLQTNKINNILMTEILNKLSHDLSKLDNLLLTAFKTAEYTTHEDLKNLGYNPFIKNVFLCKEDFKLESLNEELTFNLKGKSEHEIYDSIKANDNTFIKSKRSSYDNSTVKDCFLVLDKNSDIIFSNFSCSKAIGFLCNYGSDAKNDKFVMKDGSVPKREFNKGVYNPNTFRRDYYNNSNNSKTLKNYSIKIHSVKVKDYVDYVKSLKTKTSKKSIKN